MSARLTRVRISCAVALMAMPSVSSRAQTNAPAMTAADSTNARVDEVALRYYASQKQTARVEAEIRRLRKLHPDWQPPSDLWTMKATSSDDRQLWDLFAAGKLDELHAAIAARRAKDSAWRPSSDLELKLRRKELRPLILAQARAKRWNELIGIADKWRSDVASDDPEALWLVAEAYARADHASEALQVLDVAMKSSTRAGDRIATVQRALGLPLPMAGVEQLLALGKVDATGRGEFDAIVIDITRARISAALRDTPGKDFSAADYTKFQDFVLSTGDAGQHALLGWYALKQSRANDALDFFKSAIAQGGDATVAQGLVMTLIKLGRLRDAEEVAYAWRAPSRANTMLFLDVMADQLAQRMPMDGKRLTRYADVTLQATSGEGAEALGWYAYETCQTEAAAEWFKRAAAWLPRETAVLGYALAVQRLHRTQEFVQIINRYDGLFPSVVALMFPDGSGVKADKCQPAAASLPQAAATQARKAAFSAVPSPSQLRSGGQGLSAVDRGEFPVAVAAENPFRSMSTDQSLAARSAATIWRADPMQPVTDARRVAGVGPMPYERLGRTLLPGLGGLQQPSASPGSALQAPQGTLWAAEQAQKSVTQRQPAEAAGQFAGISAVASTATADRFHP